MKPTRFSKSLLGSALTVSFAALSANAQTTWTGTTSQDWSDPTNWTNGVPLDAADNGAAIINTAVGNFPIFDSGDTSVTDFDVYVGGNGIGRLDQTGGTLQTGNGNWMFVGENGGTGTYNLSGDGNLNSGALNVGAWGPGGATGTANINTSGTIDLTAGARPFGFGDASLLVGENGSTGTLNLQNGDINAALSAYFGVGGGSTGTLTMSGGSLDVTGNLAFGRGTGTGNGTLTGGTITSTGEIRFGQSGASTFTQSAGSVSSGSYFVIARDNGATGTYTLSGGTVNAATTDAGSFAVMGSFAGATGTLNVSGGSFLVGGGNQMIVGEGGTGTLNVSGTGLVSISDTVEGLRLGAGATGVGTVNLNGGEIQTGIVTKGDGTGTFNFNGGTLTATNSNATFMQGLTAVNVQSGGATVNSNGFDITIGQALLSDGSGGLTKTGAGTLTLTNAANTYTGTTTVLNGTLATAGLGELGLGSVTVADTLGAILTLGNATGIADTATLLFGSNSTVNLNFTGADVVGTITNGTLSMGVGTHDAATLNTFFGTSTFTGTGALTIVPEPSVALLGGLGVLGLLRRRRLN